MLRRLVTAVGIAIGLVLAAIYLLAATATADAPARVGVEEALSDPASASFLPAARPSVGGRYTDCVRVAASSTGEMTVSVPVFCLGGLCQVQLWDTEVMGAFAGGLGMPAYYTQNPSDSTWIGGPNISLGGVAFSDGRGTNGDGSPQAVYLGGYTSGGNIVSVYDDGESESSSSEWTVTWDWTLIQEEEPRLYICPLGEEGIYDRIDVSSAGWTTATVPSHCIDGMCGILMWTETDMGAFGPGFLWPAHYTQNSTSGTWIGGPNATIAGAEHSDGSGVNGDAISETVFAGGTSISGGYARLHDDSDIESSPDQWSIELVPDSHITRTSYFVFPLECEHHSITSTGATAITMPLGCAGGVCTVLMYNDGTMGPFGPGIHWPVYYSQGITDPAWIGGPTIYLAGLGFSAGSGTNGDYSRSAIFCGGQTLNGGSVTLYDDTAEYSSSQWSVYFTPASDLTKADYWACPVTCFSHEIAVPVINYRVRLPVVYRSYAQ
jgi:hypothetical protein